MVLAACLGEGPVRRRHLSTLGDRPRAKQPNRNQLDDHGGRHIRGGTPLLIISVRAVTRVDHRRAAGAGLTVGVAVDLDVQRLPQDYFRLSTLVTVMITARVTRDLALPAPSRGGPVAVVGFQLPQLPAAARCAWAMSSPARFPRHPKDDPLAAW